MKAVRIFCADQSLQKPHITECRLHQHRSSPVQFCIKAKSRQWLSSPIPIHRHPALMQAGASSHAPQLQVWEHVSPDAGASEQCLSVTHRGC